MQGPAGAWRAQPCDSRSSPRARTLSWCSSKGLISQPKEETENIRYALKRSRPYGTEPWVSKAVAQFGLENTLRTPGAPKRVPDTVSDTVSLPLRSLHPAVAI